MIEQLSILIPTRNDECLSLVGELHRQAEAVGRLLFEVIVADDSSNDETVIEINSRINALPYCRFIKRKENIGRAAIRNLLAHEARYPWLLFIDASLSIPSPYFIKRYVDSDTADVVCGGVVVGKQISGNLRCRYESEAQHRFTANKRQKHPYHSFRTCNFLIKRSTMLRYPLREDVKTYGYEDVLFGKALAEAAVSIVHIDNPIAYTRFEDNKEYIEKVEESLHTLHDHRQELSGYSPILSADRKWVSYAAKLSYQLAGRWERWLLCSHHPFLSVLKLYKIGYYSCIK